MNPNVLVCPICEFKSDKPVWFLFSFLAGGKLICLKCWKSLHKDKTWLTQNKAAECLGCSVPKVRALIKAGLLEYKSSPALGKYWIDQQQLIDNIQGIQSFLNRKKRLGRPARQNFVYITRR